MAADPFLIALLVYIFQEVRRLSAGVVYNPPFVKKIMIQR